MAAGVGIAVITAITPVYATLVPLGTTETATSLNASGCGNAVDPVLTENALTIVQNTTEPWGGIKSATLSNGGATLSTPAVNQVKVQIVTCGNIPTFGTPAAGADSGINYTLCTDISNGAGDAGGAYPVVIGSGHRGGPIYDGPYPASQGWKYCGVLQIATGPTGNVYDEQSGPSTPSS